MSLHRVVPVVVLSLLTALAGCGEMFSSALEPDRRPEELRLSAPDNLVLEGDSVQIRFEVLDQRQDPFARLPVWSTPRWTSSDDSVARVRGGMVQGVRAGDVTIQAATAELSATLALRVDPEIITLDVSSVYLVQAVQRLDGSVPLVAGRDALLRVFLTGNQWRSEYTPEVIVRLHRDGETVATFPVPDASRGLPLVPAEGAVQGSRNVRIPGELIQPGLGVTVEVDPQERLEKTPESLTHFPAEGGPLALDVRNLPDFRVRFVPVHQTATNTTGNVHAGNVESYLGFFRAVYPVAGMDVDIRAEPFSTGNVASSSEGWIEILREIHALRVVDGSSRYYYGVVTRAGGNWGGWGLIGAPAAVGFDVMTPIRGTTWAGVLFAHELGHNLGRRHAPCGNVQGIDPGFPYPEARIGVHGYDLRTEQVMTPAHRDLMSYCYEWISDYTYEGVLAFREAEAAAAPAAAPVRGPALLLWGEVGPDRLILEPAFGVETVPALPLRPGPYTLEGRGGSGEILFSFSFQGHLVDHSEAGARQFAFALPLSSGEMDGLAAIRLVGPEGVVERQRPPGGGGGAGVTELSGDPTIAVTNSEPGRWSLRWDGSSYPAALVRDAGSGLVRAILRGGLGDLGAESPAGLVVHLSDGVGSVQVDVPFR